MGYELMGRTHAALVAGRDRAAGQSGQGTVEYVGLLLLIGALFAAVVTAADGESISGEIVKRLKSALEKAGGST